MVNDCIGRLTSGISVVVVRACSTSSRIIITPLSMCGFRVVVVVVVNDVIYSRFDFGLVFVAIFVCWTFDCLLLSMSVLNENGSVSVLSSMDRDDSLLVTSLDVGCVQHAHIAHVETGRQPNADMEGKGEKERKISNFRKRHGNN